MYDGGVVNIPSPPDKANEEIEEGSEKNVISKACWGVTPASTS